MEELNCKVVFTIPIGKGLPIYESVVVTWIVMAVLVLLSIILVRNLKVENRGKSSLRWKPDIYFSVISFIICWESAEHVIFPI